MARAARTEPSAGRKYDGEGVNAMCADQVSLRFAVPADLDRICEVEAACFPAGEAAPREVLAERLKAYAGSCWLLEDGEVLAALINGMPTDEKDLLDGMYGSTGYYRENGRWMMIFGVDTAPAYRRRGCAARLMKRVIADAKAGGRAGVVLTCKERLIPYYERFGFRNEGLSASTHGGETWYQMRLTF